MISLIKYLNPSKLLSMQILPCFTYFANLYLPITWLTSVFAQYSSMLSPFSPFALIRLTISEKSADSFRLKNHEKHSKSRRKQQKINKKVD